METAGDRTVTSHAQRADRLLIRPASGRQAGNGLSARTDHRKDTREQGHPCIESQTKSTDTNLTNAPDGTPAHSQSLHRLVLATQEPGNATGHITSLFP